MTKPTETQHTILAQRLAKAQARIEALERENAALNGLISNVFCIAGGGYDMPEPCERIVDMISEHWQQEEQREAAEGAAHD